MLKILDTRQIKELDAFTIRETPIRSIDLMESACHAFVQWFSARYDVSQSVGVVCGTGNNGGDGLGIARILSEWGYHVSVWIIRDAVKESDDFAVNRGRLPTSVVASDVTQSSPKTFDHCEILIDALFGSGLSREPQGIYAEAIEAMNRTRAVRIAVDIPSGLFADSPTTGVAVKAHHTVTFQLPKLAFLLPENATYVGSWHLVDIGLSQGFVQGANASFFYLTKKAVKKILRPRQTFSHKGDFGKALLVAGSHGKMGACILAARAAMRAGLGLLTVHIPKTGYAVLQSTVPEAMVSPDGHQDVFSQCPETNAFDVIGTGPGIGMSADTRKAFSRLLESGKPMVIDADGLNLMAAEKKLLKNVPPGSILTPHPGEFARLVGTWTDDFDRLKKQSQLSADTGAVVILKGAHSSIATPAGKIYFNSTGNPGMATGGSGDVLTGVLTGLLSQKYSAVDAAILGVYLHGLSGDLAAREKGFDSLIASDLVEFLPNAFLSVTR